MGIEIKKSGVFIPNTVLKQIGLDEFEVEISEKELKFRPKSYTKRMFGFFKAEEKLVDTVIEDYEHETERRYFED
jgi:antitoxin component of MazEF toxin-antitoxin module